MPGAVPLRDDRVARAALTARDDFARERGEIGDDLRARSDFLERPTGGECRAHRFVLLHEDGNEARTDERAKGRHGIAVETPAGVELVHQVPRAATAPRST